MGGHGAGVDEVWVLGATGRSGRAIVAALAGADAAVVPVGRDAARLTAAFPDAARTVAAGSVAAMADEIRRQRPTVVISTVGPFVETARVIARACLPHSHYVDLANDPESFAAVLALHDEAVAAGRSLVVGAGFGVLATESVVAALCADRSTPARVRVDSVPSLATEEGVLGDALAAGLVEALPDGGRRYAGGRAVRVGIGSDAETLTLPDGTVVTTRGVPLGDLVAAQRASGAPSVVAASTLAPANPLVRALLPVAGVLLSVGAVRGFARRRLAQVRTPARERPREHSFAHARVEWTDGTVREGWLRLGDASEFTAAGAAAVATALAAGRGRPGADLPVATLGSGIVAAAGGELLVGVG